MRCAIVSVRLGCQIVTTNVAPGKRSTAVLGDSTGIPSTCVPHNAELLSQNKTGWTARATRRPSWPAPKQTTGGKLIKPLRCCREHGGMSFEYRVLPRLDEITDYRRVNTFCQGREESCPCSIRGLLTRTRPPLSKGPLIEKAQSPHSDSTG